MLNKKDGFRTRFDSARRVKSGMTKGFTLIELLVVIAIIGLLATIAVVALQNARSKTRDTRRVADVKQMQTALELFFNDKQRYPTADELASGSIFSTSTIGTTTYMAIIPTPPTPADGRCTSTNAYSYSPTGDGNSYTIAYCVGNVVGTISSGNHCATPAGIADGIDCATPVNNAPANVYIPFYSFNNTNGSSPQGSLINYNGVLYGMTNSGGANNYGTIFSINANDTDGNTFRTIYSFNGTGGSRPYGSLIISGSTLYGMASTGGANGAGVIFSIDANDTDGSTFRSIHSFSSAGGSQPYGSLIISGSTLYGMTMQGGTGGSLGTIFSINTDGTNFSLLHSFNSTDGSTPYGSFIISGSTLYSMTYSGGVNDAGTIFSINTDGTNFRTIYNFNSANGIRPYGDLFAYNGTFYGLTTEGGANNYGTIFSINANDTDGTTFRTIYSFNATDGSYPRGNLIISGTTLYGTTMSGGANSAGTIFSIDANDTDDTTFRLLHSLGGTDGFSPRGSLIISGGTLYGVAKNGGANGYGTIFSYRP